MPDKLKDANGKVFVPVDKDVDLSGLVLGFPLDQLLNRKCPLWPISGVDGKDRDSNRGIQLPHHEKRREFEDCNPGSGNIVICGTPGSGKSTLALQIARACTRIENEATSAYFALENRPSDIVRKAEEFGWDEVQTLCHMHCAPPVATDLDLSKALKHAVTQPPKCPIRRGAQPSKKVCKEHTEEIITSQVLVFTLSPRPLGKQDDGSEVFWHRYRELERFLSAAQRLRTGKNQNDPLNRHIFPLVVVDSLNMMTSRHPARDEMFALFSLFRNYETIGVFTVEATADTPFDSTLADVVIRLTADDDQGYFVRHIEIEKSRFVNQVNGKHPFKTTPKPNAVVYTPNIPGKGKDRDGKGDLPRRGFVAFPSLHYVVLRTGATPVHKDEITKRIDKWGSNPGSDRWGIEAFDSVLPHNLIPGSVVGISGPRGTFKSNLAMTFLAKGLTKGETGVLIRLHDQPMIASKPKGPAAKNAMDSWLESLPAVSQEVAVRNNQQHSECSFGWKKLKPLASKELAKWQALADSQKALIRVWTYSEKRPASNGKPDPKDKPHPEDNNPRLFEIDFKTGAVLAEEFVHIVREVVLRAAAFSGGKGVTRMVLDDVSEIASGYPFLLSSKTSGNLFLPAMAHIMRNEKIDLVVTGTTEELKEADEVVGRICAVADAVVSCKFVDVFGQRYVAVDSEGLVGGQGGGAQSDESATQASRPVSAAALPVIMNCSRTKNELRTFEVSAEPLEGLVGFDTGHVYRPGVTIHAFQENEGVHKRYNDEVAAMVEGLFSKTPNSNRADRTEDAHRYARGDVSLIPFDSDKSEALHDSLGLTQGKPLDRTVLYTVDEFWEPPANADKDGDPQATPVDADKRGLPQAFCVLSGKAKDGDCDATVHLYLGKNRKRDWIRRYYSNVLLLAYRRDIDISEHPLRSTTELNTKDAVDQFGKSRNYFKATSWAGVLDAANKILESSKRTKDANSPAKPEIHRAFWHDHSATETLSCALLDAWLGGCFAHREKAITADRLADTLLKRLAPDAGPAIKSVTSLAELFHLASEDGDDAPSKRGVISDAVSKAKKSVFGGHDKEALLPNDAAVYLCWYSQLRDLLDRNPEMAAHIGVCALPGGGFRGDWYVGVAQGSVSVTLGKQILKSLCDKKEGYKRFAEGVGLPPLVEFYAEDQGIPAWPGANARLRAKGVTLREVGLIHAAAASRARFENYATYRSAISAICSQLTQPFGLLRDKITDDDKNKAVISAVDKLPARIRLLGV